MADDTRTGLLLNIGSLILLLMLVGSFVTVIRAALSVH